MSSIFFHCATRKERHKGVGSKLKVRGPNSGAQRRKIFLALPSPLSKYDIRKTLYTEIGVL